MSDRRRLSARLFGGLLGAGLLLTCLLLPAGPAAAEVIPPCQPGLGVGLVETPTGTTDPRAQTYIVDHVRPGATFTRRFQVCNGTASAVTVRLSAGAARIADGGFTVLEDHTGNVLSEWITISPAVARIEPGQRLIATARFAVPADAVAGERYAALLAELPPTHSPAGVTLVQRAGIRVYLDTGLGGDPPSDFAVDSLQAVRRPDGSAAVLAQVHNTGRRAVDLRGSLQLSDGPGGLSAGPTAARLGTTLQPGDSEPVTFPLDAAMTGGPWQAVVELHSGLLTRTATAALSFPVAAGASVAVPAQPVLPYRDRAVLIPIAVLLLVLLVILLVLLTSGLVSLPAGRAATRAGRATVGA